MPENTNAKKSQVKKPKATQGSRVKKWAKEGLTLLLIMLVVSTAMDWWRNQSIPQNTLAPKVYTAINGEQYDPVSLSYEKPVLLYFWATWCGVCKFVSPTVDWMNGDYTVISVAMTSGENDRLNAYMNYHEYDFPVVNDQSGQLGRTWGISATPTIMILRDGKIASATTGISTPPGIWARMMLAK
ncbi:protein disulfide oxidoreductase [Photobacterium sanguinicancri]|uniref:protein disulfide oxidoreductase n=1 Tax=Photobacterium sanguinicancri TaxID=875932 RepID=UPI003D0E4DF5